MNRLLLLERHDALKKKSCFQWHEKCKYPCTCGCAHWIKYVKGKLLKQYLCILVQLNESWSVLDKNLLYENFATAWALIETKSCTRKISFLDQCFDFPAMIFGCGYVDADMMITQHPRLFTIKKKFLSYVFLICWQELLLLFFKLTKYSDS